MGTRVYAQRAISAVDSVRSDEQLMQELASGQQEALGPLYTRYASLVYQIGAQSLDRAAAEELVQEVFLTIWRGATNFDESQGAFRPWLLRLTHWKVLNELRTRRRRPAVSHADDEDDRLQTVADDELGAAAADVGHQASAGLAGHGVRDAGVDQARLLHTGDDFDGMPKRLAGTLEEGLFAVCHAERVGADDPYAVCVHIAQPLTESLQAGQRPCRHFLGPGTSQFRRKT